MFPWISLKRIVTSSYRWGYAQGQLDLCNKLEEQQRKEVEEFRQRLKKSAHLLTQNNGATQL